MSAFPRFPLFPAVFPVIFPLICLLISPLTAYSQDIDHWETVVFDNDTWRYLLPESEPDTSWRSLNFDDSNWPSGTGGFGYGDDDDGTVLENAHVVFTRKTFSLVDTSAIGAAIVHVDYDDAFVAFLNGIEIGRAGIGTPGDRPAFNQFASSLHEADLYQGNPPGGILLLKDQLATLLQEGENVLAVQAHNDNDNSSDLTSRAFFSVGLTTPVESYHPTPDWFTPPNTTPDQFTTTLPLVVIDTGGQIIPDEPKIIASMGIIDNGAGNLNTSSDPFNNYDGVIGIERRGASSQTFPKLSYAIETRDEIFQDLDASLLGLPEEEDWVLHGPFSDKSLMRNVLVYHLANRMGRYAPRTRYVELVLNNAYQGVYVLMEKIKRDKHRVAISKLNPDETAGDDLTGGYIIKIDKQGGAEVDGWVSPYSPFTGSTQQVFYQYHYPKPSEIVPEQEVYIQQVVTAFEDVMAGSNFADPVEGYAKYIDVDSAVDFYILNELARNVDGYRLSTFLHKEKDSEGHGKLVFGPVWDFNLGFGNADYYGGGRSNGFQAQAGVPDTDFFQPPFWWKKLWNEPAFNARVRERWSSLRQTVLHTDSLMQFIDQNVAILGEAPARNFDRWQILGTYVWPNAFVGSTYEQEITYFENWITDRLVWIDENLTEVTVPTTPGLPASSFELSAAYPNPFDTEASVTLRVGRNQVVRVEILDLTGRVMATLFEGVVQNGSLHTIPLSRAGLASGVYLIRAIGDGEMDTRKVVVF